MSTTTETAAEGKPFVLLRQAALALGLWLAALLGITAVAEPTQNVVVVGPPQRTLSALDPRAARMLDAGSGYVLVRGLQPGFVRNLYANGAWLVLPARPGGCLGPERRPS
jgi:hypothetical protein